MPPPNAVQPGGIADPVARAELKTALRHLRAKSPEHARPALRRALAREPGDVETRLLLVLSCLELDLPIEVRAELTELTALDVPDGALARRIVEELRARGFAPEALELCSGMAARATGGAKAELLERRGELCLQLGRCHDGLRALGEAARVEPLEVSRRLRLARLLLTFWDREAALAVLDELPKAARSAGEALDLRVRALLELDRAGAAREALRRPDGAESRTPEECLQRGGLFRLIGAFGEARAAFERAAQLLPASAAPQLALGELHAWAGDVAAAELRAERALELDPGNAGAHRLRAIVAILGDRLEEAEAALEKSAELVPRDPQTLLWRGELSARRGQLERGLAEIEAGITATRGYSPAAHVRRLLTVIELRAMREPSSAPGELDPDAYRELSVILEPVLAGPLVDTTADGFGGVASGLRRALLAFRGNRSASPSFVDPLNGELRRLRTPVHSRFLARELQELLRVRSPSEVIGRLESLAVERPTEPTIRCHLGEVYLWLGDFPRACAAFEAAIRITPSVRWAYAGLCAAEMAVGRYASALDWCETAAREAAPLAKTIYAYRAEVRRRLHEYDAALEDLARDEELSPGRLSTTINRALVRAEQGDASEFAPALAQLKQRSPGMIADAALELGLVLESKLADDTVRALFEHVLTMMRGNRSSSFVTYFTASGELRFALAPPLGPSPSRRGIHR